MEIAILQHNMTVRSSVWMMALGVYLAATSASAAILPTVGSGTLVAQFQANASTVTFDANNHVSSWTAANDNSIVLNATGSAHPQMIAYDATGMNGQPTIVVNDGPAGTINRVLQGAIPGTRTATTIFWLGYYAPDRDGQPGDGSYAYSYGVDGADGTQFDHQYEGFNNRIELWGGNGTQSGDVISGYNDQYTIWHTYYGQGTGNGHQAFANGTDLNVPTPNGGNYSVSGDLILFGYQNASGVSGGFNFVGNMSELLIYDGLLNAADTAAILAYLHDRQLAVSSNLVVPEPTSAALLSCGALGLLVVGRCRRFRGKAA